MNEPGSRGNGFEREEEVLLACARTRLDARQAESIRESAEQGLDWDFLTGIAARHKLTALLLWHLRALCPQAVPQSAMAALRASADEIARHNLSSTAELVRILDVFRDHGVLAIPYKGPILASLAYRSLALREFLDLDIVLRQGDVPRAHELLTQNGFEAERNWAPAEQKFREQIPGQYAFSRENDHLIVEIHSERTLRYFPRPIDLGALANRLAPVTLGGRETLTFAPEDTLPILCVHGTKHFWDRLVWISDIAELAQIPQGVDWEKVVANARELGSERTLLLGLLLAGELLQAPIPEPLLRRARANAAIRSMAQTVRRGLFIHDAPPRIAARFLFRLRMVEGVGEGLRYSLRLAMSPTADDWDSLHLPHRLAFLYPVLRPLRLLRSYGAGRTARP